ncbi:mitochondrial carnitine/acylcarnitine carrier protein [Saitoella complicata NRRL Y-17804]|uniref:Mitochondrial carrier protein n=1 Tax=Saitoella complicata (strain BCRC 22490 / CBS 7301 / JCM 7358 / NBRC 10748 / NRRL Y-17804) TaxID=698492 RepID=A0A0E9NLT5_SAICN|nr:mitochondrial carnitine/acylcarnitine carrier protein [Saitoella complicata NRRL Y-17804]ODQ56333.1 mitochondrial carnitine/acylcarnitine carrier protein [Saitoella complicata NRRL Y-17804]GAO50809.1 hypothetical protein G7K_4930-t1 [Saitoella complicata NRRL Y-17804]
MADATHVENENIRRLKDAAAGTAGGMVQVLVGQPFDIIKVRLQTQSTTNPQYTGVADAARKIAANEGPLAFYKGTLAPLLGIGACVSVQFAVFHQVRRNFAMKNAETRGDRSEDLTYGQFYVAGAAAGIANSGIAGPLERVRILLQTQPSSPSRLFNGPLDCVKKIGAEQGTLRGLYRGLVPTILREGQGSGFWFLTYEFLVRHMASSNNTTRDQLPAWRLCLCGASAGAMFWLSSYPLDVIKSKMQGFGGDAKYKGVIDCVRQTYAQGGVGAFWRGIVPTIMRAGPASASTFLTVEMTMRLLG